MKAPIHAAGTTALRLVFPPQCLCCGARVEDEGTLCPACWAETPFITGLVCDACGTPLPGEGGHELCDECLATPRPWSQGRAALVYGGPARRLVLSLKHADRLDLAPALAGWMMRAAAPLLVEGMIVAPVPLSRRRMLQRRANQAAVLAGSMCRSPAGRALQLNAVPDLLIRSRHTGSQDGLSREGRFANLAGAFALRDRHRAGIAGRPVLLVDDVMTSGATLAACTSVCQAAGSGPVSVIVLARVAKTT